MTDKALVRILTALLKHQVKKMVGDEALDEIGKELVSIGGEKLTSKSNHGSVRKQMPKLLKMLRVTPKDVLKKSRRL